MYLKDILKKILPPKVNVLLYLSLTSLQKNSYNLISNEIFKSILQSDTDDEAVEVHKKMEYNYILPNIQKLRQICTCYKQPPEKIKENDKTSNNSILNKNKELNSTMLLEYSSKFQFLDIFLTTLHDLCPNEKVVIVSNFTLTLDNISILVKSRGFGYLRIDGSVATNDRQSIVDCFNRDCDNSFIMLLSSRAGGIGINLVGGSRLIMMEPDWNPAMDHQAMSRIWREGQKKTVFIYRLVIYYFIIIIYIFY
jgi:SNF2 family DNA or RNA helicase